MKIILVLFSLAFLSLSISTTCTTNTSNQTFRAIYDSEGKPLNKSSRYFIVSAIWGAGGGGVRLANLGNQEQNMCPTLVVQSHNDMDSGIAVNFIPNDPNHVIISEMSTVNIKFYLEMSTVNIKFYLDSPTCDDYSMWKVDNYPKPAEKYTISTGEQLINSMNVNNKFQIKTLRDRVYKLVFCPYGEKFTCHNVGIADENGYNRLVLTENAKEFVFIHDKRIGMEIM